MAWICLVLAGLLEIAWAFFMKRSNGFTSPAPTALTIVTMIASFGLLAAAMRTLPLGTAYVIWTGIGAVGAFFVGIMAFQEAATPLRLLAAALVLSGILVMKLSES
jgi:quaternary ammonium compound-resistance protein SugE